ncbi:frizzled-5 [Pseudoliparis swirei]|uniref:frizzled-5 n=1 Tax=Pseudoliparis swirei TaxID=2059687 RepID=UPI0024BEBCA4|nr:frizzled-5 [Pseudoliparis swirei]XP_056284657.1 frizzled-5 [Pseudoliparis swirei]XP_056284664.1 frizzled-5 [Pseudoliparis swirei]XP_056284672.1 frizzled-5 [Pseudoliparis swirei]XP_056284681.1 frizzled-5 [Pseudoliparis swirei]
MSCTSSAAFPRLSVLLLLLLLRCPGPASGASKDLVCEPIAVPMCRGIGYNLTYMPNQFNHDTQEEVGLEVHQFWPLVRIRCSPDLLFFLCSMYTPICLPDYRKPLPPCRSVCERAKRGCSPLMSQYGFEWPERMSCERLPQLGDETLCMDRNSSEAAATTPAPPFPKPTSKGRTRPPAAPPQCDGECRCRDPLVPVERDSGAPRGRVRTGPPPDCAQPCHQPYFSADERAFTAFWVGLWSVLCFVSTLTTVATFLIDMERFKYPERPIIFLAACYLFVSLGYIVRLVAGHERVACGDKPHVLYDSAGPALCTLVFLLVYFFGMASSIWWVVLSFSWFLAAGMKWGSEAIAGYSQYFHLAAWLIPSVKTIAVLALGSVDGDPVAGICYVGNQSLENLRGFVLAPLVIYLFTGSLFLLAGFVSLFRIRSIIKQGGTKTDKLERLMIRIGLFTVLYTVPATVVVACLVYEQHYRPVWERALACSCPAERLRSGVGPDYAVFMLKYLMCLVVGITSGVWIWSGKTLESWRRFVARCCPCWPQKATAPPSMYSEASTALTGHTGTTSGVYHKAALSHI